MSLLRTNPPSSSRLRPISLLATLGTVLLAGSALTACSSTSPVEPAAPSRTAAPTGPNYGGIQVGWSVNGGGNDVTSTQTAIKPAATTSKDSVKAAK